jgi:hypothetical protein
MSLVSLHSHTRSDRRYSIPQARSHKLSFPFSNIEIAQDGSRGRDQEKHKIIPWCARRGHFSVARIAIDIKPGECFCRSGSLQRGEQIVFNSHEQHRLGRFQKLILFTAPQTAQRSILKTATKHENNLTLHFRWQTPLKPNSTTAALLHTAALRSILMQKRNARNLKSKTAIAPVYILIPLLCPVK